MPQPDDRGDQENCDNNLSLEAPAKSHHNLNGLYQYHRN
jgi:hypothetical protein